MTKRPLEVLQSVYGYRSFRAPQDQIIETVLAGNDAFVLMPTGGGKSLCYQIPALIRDGVGIIISPLIALMQDQVNALKELGIRAAFLNSMLTSGQSSSLVREVRSGAIDLLYLSPERLLSPGFLDMLASWKVALFAIDEAHCVSQWGHDFRREYMGLGILAERFPGIPRMALTATADEPTRREIVEKLYLQSAKLFTSGFDRPNIQYRVTIKNDARAQLLQFIRDEHEGDAGIIYCISRKKVEETAAWLTKQGFTAVPYHAGLSREQRDTNQERFIREEGVIAVATIAFGMGIDKPNVRFVAHLDLPKSVEAYYQETGRAGRDGLPATAWMAYGLQDVVTHRHFIDSSEAGEDRRRLEHQKLNALLGFSETAECRRKVLLSYFGESDIQMCGNCDNCLTPVSTWDGTIAAQKALSVVYRSGQRFGVGYLTSVLRGEEDERIKRFGHDRLPTFGIGKDLSAHEWSSVFRQLVAHGFLKLDGEGFGGLQLTEESRAILKGERTLALRKDTLKSSSKSKKAKKQSGDEGAAAPLPQNLFDALREKRLSIARARQIPPYVIFHDKTLVEMAKSKPKSLEELARISGVGEHKLKSYGPTFLSVILEHEEAT